MLLDIFLRLLDQHVAAQAGEVIHKQHAIEVVNLVLDHGGEEAIGIDLMGLAGLIEIFHLHRHRAFDIGILLGDRQTALVIAAQFLRRPCDNRVDDLVWLRFLVLFCRIEHQHPLHDPDLWGGEANTRRVIHGFEHVIELAAMRIGDFLHRITFHAQAAVGNGHDW